MENRTHDQPNSRAIDFKIQPSGRRKVSNLTVDGVNYAGTDLRRVMIVDSSFSNCVFDKCDFGDAGIWRSSFSKCSFISTNFKGAALGTDDKNLGTVLNAYADCNFDKADLRKSIHFSEKYSRCTFGKSKMSNVGLCFNGSIFEDCTFEGKFEDVTFLKVNPLAGFRQSNLLKRCDFSMCELRYVDFRNIDLVGVKLPQDNDHIVLNGGGDDLRKWSSLFLGENDAPKRSYIMLLAERSGTPGLVHVDDFKGKATRDQIEILRKIASGR